MIKNYLKTAFRHLQKYKSLSLINISGLVFGLFCVILIYSWIRYESSYDKFHKNADRLYRVVFTNENRDFFGIYQPGPLANHLREVVPEITHTTSYSEMQWKLSREDKGFFVIGSFVDNDFFNMFSFPLLQGDKNIVLNSPGSVVLTENLAHKLFGKINPIGETVKLNDNQTLNVTGILKDIPQNSHMQFNFLMPFKSSPDWMNQWNLKSTTTYAMLSPNSSIDQVNNKIYGIMNQHNPTWKNVLFMFPFTKSHLYNLEGGGLILYVYIFIAMGIVILIVACINFINLTTACSQRRTKEIGMRKTIGSSRSSIMLQFLVEAILIAFISMIITIFLIELVSPYLNNVLGRPLKIYLSADFILFLTGFAIHFSNLQPVRLLSSASSIGTGGQYIILRKTLVTVQFTLSIFFIISLFGIRQQLGFIQSKDLGYTKDRVLMVQTRGALSQEASIVKKALLQHAAIQRVTISGNEIISLQGTGSGPIEWPEKVTDRVVEAGFNWVDYDFLATLKMKITQGRFFSKEFETDKSDAFVVNETGIQQMEFADPIGKEITINQGSFQRTGHIIGVVKDFHAGSLHQPMYPVVMMLSERANYLLIRINTQPIDETLALIKNTIKKYVPDDPFHYEFFDAKIEKQYQIEKLTSILSTYLTVLMIIISCLGLFGLASYSTLQRTKEIGIRKVFGATFPALLYLLGKDFTKLVLLANFIAWPLAWYGVNKWLQNFAYRIDLSVWLFLLAGVVALVIALLTVSWQVIRTALANPVESLRYE